MGVICCFHRQSSRSSVIYKSHSSLFGSNLSYASICASWDRAGSPARYAKCLERCCGLVKVIFQTQDAYKSLQVFFSEKPLGATVFWTAKGAGKTYTLARVGHASNHRFVYIDWKDITGRDAKTMFYNQLKMNATKEDKPFGTYLPDDQGIFTTFVFDHFDYAMIDPDKNARALIAVLSENSTQSSIPYNILIMVNNPLHARDLLLLHGWDCHSMFVKLMGPPYCGHWFSKDLGEMSDERYNALIDQCGTLMPMISIRNGLYASDDIVYLMRATTSKEAWDNGERILAQFRYLEV